jgi:Leucine-rich repeat (LRR) protein
MGLTFIALITAADANAQSMAGNEKNDRTQHIESKNPVVLNFPTGYSIGTIIFNTDTGVKKQFPARGQMNVATGCTTKLVVNYQTGLNMSPLRAIAPDALQELDLSKLEFSSEQLRNIKHLTGLRKLDLGETDTDDNGLENLTSMQDLAILDLRATCITGKGVAVLSTLKSLNNLNLTSNNIGDPGAAALQALKGLRGLRIAQCRITDKGVASLALLDTLESIDLERNKNVTDNAVKSLTRLKHLWHLDLANTSFSAQSLKYLQQMPSLKVLIFSRNNIQPDELDEMQKKLPHCKLLSDTEYRSVNVNLFQPLK